MNKAVKLAIEGGYEDSMAIYYDRETQMGVTHGGHSKETRTLCLLPYARLPDNGFTSMKEGRCKYPHCVCGIRRKPGSIVNKYDDAGFLERKVYLKGEYESEYCRTHQQKQYVKR